MYAEPTWACNPGTMTGQLTTRPGSDCPRRRSSIQEGVPGSLGQLDLHPIELRLLCLAVLFEPVGVDEPGRVVQDGPKQPLVSVHHTLASGTHTTLR
jgi:hypothetical protein